MNPTSLVRLIRNGSLAVLLMFAAQSTRAATQEAELTPAVDPVIFIECGYSVSLSGDGTTALVGAYQDDTARGNRAGSAYVFVRNGTAWTQQAKLEANDGETDDWFGYSVSISEDGKTALVGALTHSSGGGKGCVYVFARDGTTWTPHQYPKLEAGDGAAGDYFGMSVSVNGDGDMAVVGAPFADKTQAANAGSAYVFILGATGWEAQKLEADDGEAEDRFGMSVSASGDGNTVVVGAPLNNTLAGPDAGSAYVFIPGATEWGMQKKLEAADGAAGDQFGYSVSVSGNGKTALVGAPRADTMAGTDAGSAYVFVRSGSTWGLPEKLEADDGTDGDTFGYSVSVSGDGNTAAVVTTLGDPQGTFGTLMNAGGAFVFTRCGSNWTQEAKLTAHDGVADEAFGIAVSVSGDGNAVLVGALLPMEVVPPVGYGDSGAIVFRVASAPECDTPAYWDLNGAEAGAGSANPTGTWDAATTNWNPGAAGTGATNAWTAGQTAIFAAGTDASGAYSVTVSGTQDIGGLTFEEGTVRLTGGTALRLVANSTADVAAGLTATVATPLTEDSPSRQLTKTGAGTLVLLGNSTYTGATTVAGGKLCVLGAIASPTTVMAGATLGGSGTVYGQVIVTPGGAHISPGCSIGTLTTGPATIDGTYVCELDGAACDKLVVNGDLDLTGATLDLAPLGTPAAPDYVIATYSGTLTGTFTVVGMPTGYTVDYLTPGQVKLVAASPGTANIEVEVFGYPTIGVENSALEPLVSSFWLAYRNTGSVDANNVRIHLTGVPAGVMPDKVDCIPYTTLPLVEPTDDGFYFDVEKVAVGPDYSYFRFTLQAYKPQEFTLVAVSEAPYSASSTMLIEVVQSWDPNNKAGLSGIGANHYITGSEVLPYVIHFENDPELATAPARSVLVTDQLDTTKLDLATFSLGPITFGSHIIYPPGGVQYYTEDIPFDVKDPTLEDIIVRVEAKLDANPQSPNYGLFTCKYSSLEPGTLVPVVNPMRGFLPPNLTPPEGEGSVRFTIKAKPGLADGTVITNGASIVFDTNPAIITPEWSNTLDLSPPESEVSALPAFSPATFKVTWSGSDSGSGIASYDIWVSDNGGTPTLWRDNTTATEGSFSGIIGHTYQFYSVARDALGHTEGAPATPDASTTVSNCAPYGIWASGYGLTGADALMDADPDHDGANNLIEFATNGNPASGTSGPRCYPLLHVIGGDSVLTFTLAVRQGAVFAPAAPPDQMKQTATVDCVVYTVEGSANLAAWDMVVTEFTGADAAAVQSALGAKLAVPPLGADWRWHTFRLAGHAGENPAAFIRVKAQIE